MGYFSKSDGLVRTGKRRPWKPSAEAQARLQELTRAKQALQKEKTRTQNRLNEARDEAVRRTYEHLLEQIDKKIDALEEEIEDQVEKDQKLYDRCRLLETIPGVGLQAAAIVISELSSIDRLESARQAGAYAGLVPSPRESGTSVRGRPRMSKLGNAKLRRALSFPAMSALQCNPTIKAFRNRLKERGKEKNGRARSRHVEATAHLLRSDQERTSLRCIAASRHLIRLTFTTASVGMTLINVIMLVYIESVTVQEIGSTEVLLRGRILSSFPVMNEDLPIRSAAAKTARTSRVAARH